MTNAKNRAIIVRIFWAVNIREYGRNSATEKERRWLEALRT